MLRGREEVINTDTKLLRISLHTDLNMLLLQNLVELIKKTWWRNVPVSLELIDVRFQSKLKMYFWIENGGISYWVGDGFCDDINNNEKCNYDNGDCCGLSMKKNFCVQCICKGKSNSF